MGNFLTVQLREVFSGRCIRLIDAVRCLKAGGLSRIFVTKVFRFCRKLNFVVKKDLEWTL